MFPSRPQARFGARGLGWFSLGLGAIELLAGSALARAIGLRGQGALVRAYGVREITTGLGLLNAADPTPWVWGRVAGDVLDLATLVPGLTRRRRSGEALAVAAVAGIAAVDLVCARRLSRAPAAPQVDYSRRSGWPLPADEMRGVARMDFLPPNDMCTPKSLRPWCPPNAVATQGAVQAPPTTPRANGAASEAALFKALAPEVERF